MHTAHQLSESSVGDRHPSHSAAVSSAPHAPAPGSSTGGDALPVREAGCVKHQADALHIVKHLLDLRCQVSARLLQRTSTTKTVSAMYALGCHNL
jgi:hypothetical protein